MTEFTKFEPAISTVFASDSSRWTLLAGDDGRLSVVLA